MSQGVRLVDRGSVCRVGLGIGIMPAGFGLSASTTIFTPSIGEIFDAIFGFSEFGEGGRYPASMLDPCRAPWR